MRKLLLVGMMILTSITTFLHKLVGKYLTVKLMMIMMFRTIIIEGTSDGTVSGFDGTFTLDVGERRKSLVVSYLGYETAVVAASVETNVGLTPDLNVLGEVVVSSGVIDIVKSERNTS